MSRQAAHLPPRYPILPSSRNGSSESYPRHHKSSSQSSILDDQPAWLDDLLSDRDSQSKGTFHRRSASDSVTLWDGLAYSSSGLSSNNGENPVGNDVGIGLESNCIYGPNSPRRKGNLTFSEKAIVSALSEYVSQEPLQHFDEGLPFSGVTLSDSKGATCGLVGDLSMETKPAKRHAGQRSRVRKLQYIAELEKTVNVFETLESELTVRVASLVQQRVALSLENSKLKQQVARIQHEKLIMEGQYQSLKKEAERLKTGLVNSSKSKGTRYRSEPSWQMLDMGKLHLNSN